MKTFRRTVLVVLVLPAAVLLLFSTAVRRSVHLAGAGSVSAAISPPDAAYVQAFEKWKAEQAEDLKQNWLPLAGLYWLKPGVNNFGSDPSNAVVFPKGPAHAGEFNLSSKEVRVKMLLAAHATFAGKPFTEGKLDPDISGHPTVVEMGSLQFRVIVRGERIGIRLKDTESPAVHNFVGMQFYPLDLNYRVTANWRAGDGK
jgi:uncharacterized protein